MPEPAFAVELGLTLPVLLPINYFYSLLWDKRALTVQRPDVVEGDEEGGSDWIDMIG